MIHNSTRRYLRQAWRLKFKIGLAMSITTSATTVEGLTAKRLKGFDAPTVWQEFSPLAVKHKAVNLGQGALQLTLNAFLSNGLGFPDWETPEFAKKAFCDAIHGNYNQYCRSAGEMSLVEALARHYGPLIGRSIDPLTEVTISVGATEAICAITQALLDEGDEVLLLEPAFDIYPAQVQMAGGISKFVSLELDVDQGKWILDFAKLEAAITPKTKLFILNTPHNPTGKVFSREELEIIAGILSRNPRVVCVTDEVYEKLVYDNKEHIRLASLPGSIFNALVDLYLITLAQVCGKESSPCLLAGKLSRARVGRSAGATDTQI